MPPGTVVCIGCDIGQAHDPTAIIVAEAEDRLLRRREPMFGPVEEEWELHYVVRHLERLPLGTPYPDVVEAIAERVAKLREQNPTYTLHAVVDQTGVGKPIVDMLRVRLRRDGMTKRCHVTGVSITGSEKGDEWAIYRHETTIGKAFMVSRLQQLMQMRRLHVPKTAEAEAFTRELRNFEIRISQTGHDSYGAFRVGTHDDYVTALGLATLQGRRAEATIGPPIYQ